MDLPNERSSHERPTPRGGGIAIVAGVGVALVASGGATSLAIECFLVSFAFGLVGLVEDLRGLSVRLRLGSQAAISMVGMGLIGAGWFEGWWVLVLAVGASLIWIVGFTNAFNFMDGINGISAAQLIVAGISWAIAGEILDVTGISTLGLITAGAALGFLPWNFPRAQFFMGDVGSYYCGSWLALAAVQGIRAGISPLVMVAPLIVYGVDTSSTLLIRVARREAWIDAHRSHIYQRLVVGGWSHTHTTLFFLTITTLVAGSGLLFLADSVCSRVGGTIGILVGVICYAMAPRWQRRSIDLSEEILDHQ
jgi:UDP-N-acetylmuramyl pentapeptide phosphotransferase/UDP-N-acetylglucosamine-1-phosphate transferase